jgi:hypothetical protein
VSRVGTKEEMMSGGAILGDQQKESACMCMCVRECVVRNEVYGFLTFESVLVTRSPLGGLFPPNSLQNTSSCSLSFSTDQPRNN